METTLERIIKPWDRELAEKSEGLSLRTFQKKVHHYLAHDVLPESKLGWLALMQHHGAPTRLLDFTESPFIALFFAFDGIDFSDYRVEVYKDQTLKVLVGTVTVGFRFPLKQVASTEPLPPESDSDVCCCKCSALAGA